MNNENPRCGWNTCQGEPAALDELHAILMCAARRGCAKCVTCSERALALVLEAAGKGDRMPLPSTVGSD